MNQKQFENEDKIFQAIQDLKDSIFGLKQPYIRYCYEYTEEDGYVFSRERTGVFAHRLTMCARETRTYSEELSAAIPLFFEMCAMLLAAICGKGDWIFVSFRKIAKAALKSSPEEESVLERIVKNSQEDIDDMFPDGAFWVLYEEFRPYMGQVDAEGFYLCVKHALEDFLDEHHLNALDKDKATESMVARINRLSAAIERDLSRSEFSGEDGR